MTDRATTLRTQALDFAQTMERLLLWRPQIEDAMARTTQTHSFDDIVDMVARGDLIHRFWDDAFALITVVTFPQARHYHIWIAGGTMTTLIGAVPALKEDAQRHECQRITISGRPGWARALKDIGAAHANTIMTLEVQDNGITVAGRATDADRPEAAEWGVNLRGHADVLRGQEPVGHGVSRPPTGGHELSADWRDGSAGGSG